MVPHDKTFPIPGGPSPTLVDRHRWHNRYFELEEQTFSYRTARTTVRWLEENYRSPQPFFLWVDFFDPHEPWDPPEYLVRRYDPDYAGTPMIMPNYGLATRYTPAELANLRAHYLAETELVDRHVGRILEKIEDLELWQDTVVVFASDHGTSLGEHGRTSKINRDPDDPRYWTLSPELSHIPLLVAAPGVTPGARHPVFAQPVDLMPTLFDLSGVAADGAVATPQPLHGHSLAAVLRGHDSGRRAATLSGIVPRRDRTGRRVAPWDQHALPDYRGVRLRSHRRGWHRPALRSGRRSAGRAPTRCRQRGPRRGSHQAQCLAAGDRCTATAAGVLRPRRPAQERLKRFSGTSATGP